MTPYFQQFAASVSGRYVVQTECTATGMTLLCSDLAGNLIASRMFTTKQLRNAPLVSLVMSDLRATLDKLELPLTPLPESLHPSAS
ncbi:hypothetical protein [Pseudomonas argentinensis]|uniref:hypothetical protein n=1 Tax=Phytopseudomonas argentinensis TaxID=289370 RepID=UPI0008A91E63|nr:hypothetical protein [Pseudomonas argentinensis]